MTRPRPRKPRTEAEREELRRRAAVQAEIAARLAALKRDLAARRP